MLRGICDMVHCAKWHIILYFIGWYYPDQYSGKIIVATKIDRNSAVVNKINDKYLLKSQKDDPFIGLTRGIIYIGWCA